MQFRPTALALAVIGLMAQAQAQQATPTPEVQKIERVEVTGTNLKRTDTETASPVQVLKADEIMRSGVSSITELLQLLPAVTSGGQSDLTSGNGFAAGTATASLRGLGSSSTLTLINGRRLAATATADPNSGQSTLYNLNNIPVSAIERVEVLKDGASAVYGSDAIAGVVNFILKKEYKGLEASLRASGVFGTFKSSGASLFGGFGDLDTQNFNVMYGVDLTQRDDVPIGAATRGFDYGAYQRAYGTTIEALDSALAFSPNFWRETGVGTGVFNTTTPIPPKNGVCPAPSVYTTTFQANGSPICAIDNSPYTFFQYPSRSGNFFAKASFNVGKDMFGTIEANFTRIENEYMGGSGYATLGSGLSTWFDKNGVRRSFRHIMRADHPDNPLFQADPNNKIRLATSARLGDIPAGTFVTNDATRFVADLQGTNWGWDWNTGILYNSSKRTSVEKGAVNSVTAQAALDQYRFGGTNSAALLAQISPDMTNVGDTSVSMFNLKGSREFGKLAGGAIGVAAGLESRRESIDIRPDANLDAGNYVGRGTSKATGSRTVNSFFAEVNLPVLKSFNIEAALRADRYSDYGNSTTPKLGFKWKATDSLSFRGTAAEGFRAPGLTQISSSAVTSFQSISTWRDPIRCPVNAAGVAAQIPGATGYESATECSTSGSRTIASTISPNTKLEPEKSRSYTLGVVFAPTSSLSGTFDLYQISRRNEIDRYSSNDVLRKLYQEGDTFYADSVFRSPDEGTLLKDASGKPIPGTTTIVGVKRKYLNLGETIVRGADLELNHRMKLGDAGRLSTTLFIGYMKDFLFQREKGGPFADNSDGLDNPRFKGRLSANLATGGAWNYFGAVNYVGDMQEFSTNSATGVRTNCSTSVSGNAVVSAELGGDCRVASFTTFDLGATYTGIKNLTLSATVRNVFGREAPFDWLLYTYYNTALHNAQGRTLSLNARYVFK